VTARTQFVSNPHIIVHTDEETGDLVVTILGRDAKQTAFAFVAAIRQFARSIGRPTTEVLDGLREAIEDQEADPNMALRGGFVGRDS